MQHERSGMRNLIVIIFLKKIFYFCGIIIKRAVCVQMHLGVIKLSRSTQTRESFVEIECNLLVKIYTSWKWIASPLVLHITDVNNRNLRFVFHSIQLIGTNVYFCLHNFISLSLLASNTFYHHHHHDSKIVSFFYKQYDFM